MNFNPEKPNKQENIPEEEQLLNTFSFSSFLSQQQRKHLQQLFHFLTKEKEKLEVGKESFLNFLKISEAIFLHFEKDIETEKEKERFISLLMSWFRSKEAPKSGEGEMMGASFYKQLLEDSINEYMHKKGIEHLSSFFSQENIPTFSFLVQEHNKKKKLEFTGESGPVGKIILDNLSYVDKEGRKHENVFLVQAEDEEDLVRATRYASEQSHVCIGDEGQSYRKKLNKTKEENGVEVYFLWEGDPQEAQDGGRYLQIITYNKKSKKIEQMKGYNNHMIDNNTDYLPALFSSLSFLSEKRELKSIGDTGNYQLKEGNVLTLKGEKGLDELEEGDLVVKGKYAFDEEDKIEKLKKIFSIKGMKIKVDNMNDFSLKTLKLLSEARAEIEIKDDIFISEKIEKEKASLIAQIEGTSLKFTSAEAIESFFHEELREVRGSVDIQTEEVVYLPFWESVGGSLYASNAQNFSAPNLESVGGDFYAENAQNFSVPKLESVGGYLDASNAQSFSVPKLESVGGYLDAQNAQSFSAPNLESVGEYLDASNTQSFSVPKLESVGGDLYAEKAQSFSAPNLEFARGDLYAEKAQNFSAPNLRKVETLSLSRKNFKKYFQGENFDFSQARVDKMLIIHEEIENIIMWK